MCIRDRGSTAGGSSGAAAMAASEWWKGGADGGATGLHASSPFETADVGAEPTVVAEMSSLGLGGDEHAPSPGLETGNGWPPAWAATPRAPAIGEGAPFTADKYRKGWALLLPEESATLTALGYQLRESLTVLQEELVATLGNSALWRKSGLGGSHTASWDADEWVVGHDAESVRVRSRIMAAVVNAQQGPSQGLVDFVEVVGRRVFDGIEGEPAEIESYAKLPQTRICLDKLSLTSSS